MRLGALFDIVNSLTAIGTAVALYAVIRRQNQGFAIGFVSSRLFEGTVLMIGVISILSIVTLQQPGATGAEASLLVTVQHTLVTVRNWTFVLGTGVPALNAFLLGWIMYRSRLVPRAIPVLGLIGAPLFTSWVIGYVLGVTEPGTAWHAIGVAPIFIWELSLGLWMTFKGFRKDAPLMVEAAAEDAELLADTAASTARRSAWRPMRARHDRRPRAGASNPATVRGSDVLAAAPRGLPGHRGRLRPLPAGGRQQVRDASAHDDRTPVGPVAGRDHRLLRGRSEPRDPGHERLGREGARLVAEPPGAAGRRRSIFPAKREPSGPAPLPARNGTGYGPSSATTPAGARTSMALPRGGPRETAVVILEPRWPATHR